MLQLYFSNAKFSEQINNKSKFFVIKIHFEEDVHKAIKYNIWSSSKKGNIILNNAFKNAKKNNEKVLLFFMCYTSGRLLGVAQILNEVNFNKVFSLWVLNNKKGGVFDIEWKYIKDVPYKIIKHIKVLNEKQKEISITFAKDLTEIEYKNGRELINIINNYKNKHSILQHFQYYDERQKIYEEKIN